MKKTGIRYIMLGLTVAFAVMIFLFSAQPREISGESSGRLTKKILQIFLPQLDAEKPEDAALIERFGAVFRKCAHFAEFFAFGASLFGFFATFERPYRWRFRLTLGIGVLYAASDEIHQIFVPDRGPSVYDVMLDSFGVFCGVLAVTGVILLALRRKEKRLS